MVSDGYQVTLLAFYFASSLIAVGMQNEIALEYSRILLRFGERNGNTDGIAVRQYVNIQFLFDGLVEVHIPVCHRHRDGISLVEIKFIHSASAGELNSAGSGPIQSPQLVEVIIGGSRCGHILNENVRVEL